MSENAKNELLELLKNLGCTEDAADFQPTPSSSPDLHCSTVTVRFPDGSTVRAASKGRRQSEADTEAAQIALAQVCSNYPNLLVNWDEISIEAQAGDALIKLAVYLSGDLKSTADKSKRLQEMESNSHLAEIFDQWKAQGDSDLAIWGTNLSKKRKATFIEALLWRRFGGQVIAADAPTQLQSLLAALLGRS